MLYSKSAVEGGMLLRGARRGILRTVVVLARRSPDIQQAVTRSIRFNDKYTWVAPPRAPPTPDRVRMMATNNLTRL